MLSPISEDPPVRMPTPLQLMPILLVLLPLAGGCSTNPATGRSYFDALPRDQEIALGLESKPQLVANYGGEVRSAEVRGYVTRVGNSLARHTEGDFPSLPWQFTVLDTDVLNAFALPGGQVFITKGLLKRFTSEAQLASVLGHEIGHVTAQHIDEQISRDYARSFGVQLLGALASGSGAGAQLGVVLFDQASGTFLLSFDRDQEHEADELGLRYMVAEGYNPLGSWRAMRALARASEGEARPPEFMSTHPATGSRVSRIRRLVDTQYRAARDDPSSRVGSQPYQTRVLDNLALLPTDERNTVLAQTRLAMLSRHAATCAGCTH
ncbi:MAG: M48 family metalloprotease [Planctomycetota bacterium]